MKKIAFFSLIILLIFPLCACKKQEVNYQKIVRDDYSTGGDLSFAYDEISHTAYFGGEGEYIQYYDSSIIKNWQEEGNRIGFKIPVPKTLDNYLSAKATCNGKDYENGEFYNFVNGKPVFAEFYPLVKSGQERFELNITWQNSIKPQKYFIVIKNGTKLIEKTSNETV